MVSGDDPLGFGSAPAAPVRAPAPSGNVGSDPLGFNAPPTAPPHASPRSVPNRIDTSGVGMPGGGHNPVDPTKMFPAGQFTNGVPYNPLSSLPGGKVAASIAAQGPSPSVALPRGTPRQPVASTRQEYNQSPAGLANAEQQATVAAMNKAKAGHKPAAPASGNIGSAMGLGGYGGASGPKGGQYSDVLQKLHEGANNVEANVRDFLGQHVAPGLAKAGGAVAGGAADLPGQVISPEGALGAAGIELGLPVITSAFGKIFPKSVEAVQAGARFTPTEDAGYEGGAATDLKAGLPSEYKLAEDQHVFNKWKNATKAAIYDFTQHIDNAGSSSAQKQLAAQMRKVRTELANSLDSNYPHPLIENELRNEFQGSEVGQGLQKSAIADKTAPVSASGDIQGPKVNDNMQTPPPVVESQGGSPPGAVAAQTGEGGVSAPTVAETPKTPETGTSTSEQPILAAARKSHTEPANAALGQPDIILQHYDVPEEVYRDGKAAVEAPVGDPSRIDPRSVADEVSKKPRQLSKPEIGALVYDQARLAADHGALDEAISKASGENLKNLIAQRDALAEQLGRNYEALRKGGREASSALNAYKIAVDRKFDYTSVKTDYTGYGGKAPSPKLDSSIAEWSAKEAGAGAKAAKAGEELSAMNAEKQVAEQGAGGPKKGYTGADALAEVQKIKAQFLEDMKATLGKTHSATSAIYDVSAAHVKAIAGFAKVGFKLGINSLSKMVDFVSGHFQHLPEDQRPSEQAIIDTLAGKYNEKKGDGAPFHQSAEANAKSEVSRTAKAQSASADYQAKGEAIKGAQDMLRKAKTADEKKAAQTALRTAVDNAKPLKVRIAGKSQELLKAQAQQKEAQKVLNSIRDSAKGKDWYQRILNLQREGVISSPGVFPKIGSSGIVNSAVNTITEPTIGRLYGARKVGKQGTLGEIGTTEGNATLKSTVIGSTPFNAPKEGATQAVNVLKTGVDPTQAILHPERSEKLGPVTRTHAATQQFQVATEMAKNRDILLNKATKAGEDVSDPKISARINFQAATSTAENTLRGDNPFSAAINQASTQWLASPNKGVRMMGFFSKAMVPVLKLPLNFLRQTTHYVAGLPEAEIRLMAAKLSKTDLSAAEADNIIRMARRGGVGAAGTAYVLARPDDVREFFKWIDSNPTTKLLVHHPFFEAMRGVLAARDGYAKAGVGGAIQGAAKEVGSKLPGVYPARNAIETATGRKDPLKGTIEFGEGFVPLGGLLRTLAPSNPPNARERRPARR